MIDYELRPGAVPLVVAPDELCRASVGEYLDTLDEHVPGLDMRFDYAIAVGRLAAREIRAGRWDEHRKLAAHNFDEDEFDFLALAAVSILAPGPVPEPFAFWIALAEDARFSGLSPDALAEKLGPYLVPATPDEGEDG